MRLLDQLMSRSSWLMSRLNDSWFECRKCDDRVVPSKSKWIRDGWNRLAKWVILDASKKEIENESDMGLKCSSNLPTFTSCCCFLLATVSNSTEGSGFWIHGKENIKHYDCGKCFRLKKWCKMFEILFWFTKNRNYPHCIEELITANFRVCTT